MNNIPQDLSSAAIAALENGSKIEAIKQVRIERRVSLKDAKDIVEQFLDRSPELQNRMRAVNREQGRRGLAWIVVIAVIALIAYCFHVGQP